MPKEMKRCKQCGLLKPEDDFRKYSYSRKNDTAGRLSLCKACETLNTQYRRAVAADDIEVVNNIAGLYAELQQRGLHVPTMKAARTKPRKYVDEVLAFHQVINPAPQAPVEQEVYTTPEHTESLPSDLAAWLTADTGPVKWREQGLSPEFLQETVYESLKAKYRPQEGVDKVTMLPVYDDTYKQALSDILRRFDDYEEEEAYGNWQEDLLTPRDVGQGTGDA